MLYNEDLEKMINEGMDIKEIAYKFSEYECADEFGMESNECHEDADCNDCWINCLTQKLKSNE